MINLEKEKTYLLACSFGPDSMALFDMLLKGGYSFGAALVNYHLRSESTQEMNDFIAYCKDKGITYHVKETKMGNGKGNIEANCRKIRYEFFAELVNEYHYDSVLVAHNEDDLIETYLMQKMRQNLVNYYGIKEKMIINGVEIIRPLLGFTKQYLLDYCNENKVPYAIDNSNYQNIYLRNRVRHQIMANLSREEKDNILKEITIRNKLVELTFAKLKLLDLHSVNVLLSLDEIELSYAINSLISEYDISIKLSLGKIRELRKILADVNGNFDVSIKGQLMLRKSYDRVDIIMHNEVNYSYIIVSPQIVDNEYFYLNLLSDTSNRNIYEKDYPLTIRNFRKGDKYKIKDYEVLVRRLFIDWKMPTSYRERWPIILNKDGIIIYIPRYRKDFEPSIDENFYVK